MLIADWNTWNNLIFYKITVHARKRLSLYLHARFLPILFKFLTHNTLHFPLKKHEKKVTIEMFLIHKLNLFQLNGAYNKRRKLFALIQSLLLLL